MLNDFIDGLIATVQAIDPVWQVLLAGLAIMLETSLFIGLLVPGDAVLLLAATGVNSWGSWLALVVAGIVGALIGESIGYAIGRWAGEPVKRSWVGRVIGVARWEQAERYLQRRGMLAVFVSRYLPVLHSVVPVTAGMAKMPYRRFMAATVPACTLWALVYVTVGALATASYQALGKHLHLAGFVFAAIVVVFALVSWWVKRRLQQRIEHD